MIVNPIVVSAGGKAKKDPELKLSEQLLRFTSGGYSRRQNVQVTRLGDGEIYACAGNHRWAAFVDGENVTIFATDRVEFSSNLPNRVTVLLEETEEYSAAKAEVSLRWDGAEVD